jgi:hypothetical protein
LDILKYIVNEGLIMIPVLFVLAEIIKQAELVVNKWLPLILLGISLIMTPLVLGGYTADNLVQAILLAGAAVYSDQIIKQTNKGVK